MYYICKMILPDMGQNQQFTNKNVFMKKSLFSILLIAVFSFGLVSCNQAQKMIDAADQITIKCDPEVLEVVA